MNRQTIVGLLVLLCLGAVAVADDRELNEQRAKAAEFERQADWKLQFEDWDKLAVYGKPETNGAVITVHMIEVKDLVEALNLASSKKNLAVVILRNRFHWRYAEPEGDKQIDTLSEKIKQSGFKRVVFLTETAVGNLVRRE